MVSIKKMETRYQISDDEGNTIQAYVNHKLGTLCVDPMGGDIYGFKFIDEKPEAIEALGILIVEASKLLQYNLTRPE